MDHAITWSSAITWGALLISLAANLVLIFREPTAKISPQPLEVAMADDKCTNKHNAMLSKVTEEASGRRRVIYEKIDSARKEAAEGDEKLRTEVLDGIKEVRDDIANYRADTERAIGRIEGGLTSLRTEISNLKS